MKFAPKNKKNQEKKEMIPREYIRCDYFIITIIVKFVAFYP